MDENNGPGGAGLSLREALALSTAPGSRIRFSPSLFSGTITLNGTQLDIPATPGLFIDASGLTTPATISGNNASRVFNIPATATVAMHSVRIVNGRAADGVGGGGIQNAGACTVLSSTLSANHAVLSGFQSHEGGGIANTGTCTMHSSTLSGNSASGVGGGMVNYGTCTMHSSTLSGNSAEVGGGMVNYGTCTVLSSTLSGNSASGDGGGMVNYGTCTVLSSTLSGNSAEVGIGGGIRNTGTFSLASSIVAGNTASSGPNISGTLATNTNNLIDVAPLLAPLGNYGGPTQTMPPRPGSPAIDAAAATTAQTDQRGFPRTRDGDGNGTALPDIGAVEASHIIVTVPGDNVPGSLRAALTEAAAQPGPDTIYFTAAVTPHITLASEILITDPAGVTLDATDRPTGLVIDAGTGTNRHFRIEAGTTAVFNRLRLYGGGGTGGGAPPDYGGSILNGGALTLRECTFSDNSSANAGGAVYNQTGSLTVDRCTFHGNTSGSSGAILHESLTPMTITASTFTGNIGRFEGGAITLGGFRAATITHCTITGNAVAQTGGGGSGGIRAGNPGNGASNLLTLRDSIVTGNTDANFPGTPNVNPGFISQGSNLIGPAPVLAALGDYGGPTWTMPPMPGSQAIDNALTSTAATDQRGLPRPIDGDLDNSIARDLGAVEVPGPLTVDTVADQNDVPAGFFLSLREAIRDAQPGATILFASSFNGQPADTITLTTGSEITFTKGLILNASANPGGVTINGGTGTNRIFYLPAGTGASLHRLTLTGGNGEGGNLVRGGAILCKSATLALADCTLTENTSLVHAGGAIANESGTVTLDRCLLSNNSASSGGAIFNLTEDLTGPATSSTTLTNCTITNNTVTQNGGGIHNENGRVTLLHCTLTGNTAPAGAGSGVASYGDPLTRTTVQNCLIAGNANASDINVVGGFTLTVLSLGGNLIGTTNFTGAFNQPGDATAHTAATLRLAPLADYGGPTHTIALRPTSPARDNATTSPITTDQRSFGIAIGTKDSGAYEAGNYFLENFNVFAQEFLPPTATDPQRARTFDFDSDGQTNETEWGFLTNPGSSASLFNPNTATTGANFTISFPTVAGRSYRLQQSNSLPGAWVNAPGFALLTGNGAEQSYVIPTTGVTRRFYQVLPIVP